MLRGQFTLREEEIIRQLLAEKGITRYAIVDPVNEGKSLPGSTFPCEIETVSGYIVTTSALYLFWLDWFDGHYTLGEHRGFWEEVSLDQLGADKEPLLAVQQHLQKKGRAEV